MAEFFEMPAVSPTMETGNLVEWKIKEGERFSGPAVIADVATDKATLEAEIFEDGVLIKYLIAEGDDVPPGFPIAIFGESVDEPIDALLTEFATLKAALAGSSSSVEAPPVKEAPAPVPKTVSPPVQSLSVPVVTWRGKEHAFAQEPLIGYQVKAPANRVIASPLARAVAKATGVDLQGVSGSGPNGRIVRADVESAKHAPSVAQQADVVVKNSPMRKTIAKRLLASHQDIPVFFLTATFDMAAFVAFRSTLKSVQPETRVSYNDLLIKAVGAALAVNPAVNASWDNNAITRHGRVDIGVAVALPDGLITPVIRDVNSKGVSHIGAEVRELAGRAKEGKLGPAEYTGSTFTISNLGMFAIDQFTAIVNPPESAILAVGSLRQEPVVQDGQLAVGWRMKVTMSCDHRVIDGVLGAQFLKSLRTFVENPQLILL